MKHYICTGECGGVSDKPGVCNDKECTLHGKSLVECNCKFHTLTDKALIPYLNFDGTITENAMRFYESIFGGELTMQTFGEAGMAKETSEKDFIIHAELKSNGIHFMASSGHPGINVKFGDNLSLSINGSDENLLKAYFEKLGDGGKITMPLEKQFWGDTFGMLTDKFGVQWMVNIASKK